MRVFMKKDCDKSGFAGKLCEWWMKGYFIRIILVCAMASLSWYYVSGGVNTGVSALNITGYILLYSLPLMIVAALYGIESGLVAYAIVILMGWFVSGGVMVYLFSYHLLGMYLAFQFTRRHWFKTIKKTLIAGLIATIPMGMLFFVLFGLTFRLSFMHLRPTQVWTTLVLTLPQNIVSYLVIYSIFRFTPKALVGFFPINDFRNEYRESEGRHYRRSGLETKLLKMFMTEALILGVLASAVSNLLIPSLTLENKNFTPRELREMFQQKVEESKDTIGENINNEEVRQKFDAAVTGIEGAADVAEQAYLPIASELGLTDLFTDGYEGETIRENGFTISDDSRISFDLMLILTMLSTIFPLVAIINLITRKFFVAPLVSMSNIMDNFNSGDEVQRKRIEREMDALNVHTGCEIETLYNAVRQNIHENNLYIDHMQEDQKLREDLRVAKASNEAKTQFLSNMSHEIRTPINAVLGLDEKILRESREENIIRYATDIQNSGKTLLSIVNDILDSSRIESGKLEIIPVDYELSSSLNDLVNMISVKAKEKNLELKVNVDPKTPHSLHGDEIRIKQCILNILTNAVKYTKEGTVTMNIGFTRLDESRIKLFCQVIDTGIGIKEEDIDKLFKRFERIEEERNRTIEGTGLGMSIVQNLLSMMDSKLEVKSVYGEGSDFSFEVEQGVRDWDEIGNFTETYERAMKEAAKYEESFHAPDAHILVVDDTKMNLTVVKGLLKETQIQIDTAMSGMEAISLAKENRYDIIFLDQRMPEMDGIETLHKMRELPEVSIEDVPVIALTANAVSGAREMFIAEGFDNYLTKPIDSAKLERLIIKYLPDNKVIFDKSEKSDNAGDTPARTLGIPGLDCNAALSNCGTEELFMQALTDYYTAIPDNYAAIEEYCGKEDIKNYTIKVHALKSSSRIIGAFEISKEAEYLERCGDEGRLDEIKEKTPELLNKYAALSEELKYFFETGNKGGKEADDREEISLDKLNEAYGAIKEFMNVFDYDNAESVLDMLKEYRIPEDETDKYEKVKQLIFNLDRDGVLELLNK